MIALYRQKTRLLGVSISLGATCLLGALTIPFYEMPKLEAEKAKQQYELRLSRAALQREEQNRRERFEQRQTALASTASSPSSIAPKVTASSTPKPAIASKPDSTEEEFFEVDVLDPEDGE